MQGAACAKALRRDPLWRVRGAEGRPVWWRTVRRGRGYEWGCGSGRGPDHSVGRGQKPGFYSRGSRNWGNHTIWAGDKTGLWVTRSPRVIDKSSSTASPLHLLLPLLSPGPGLQSQPSPMHHSLSHWVPCTCSSPTLKPPSLPFTPCHTRAQPGTAAPLTLTRSPDALLVAGQLQR